MRRKVHLYGSAWAYGGLITGFEMALAVRGGGWIGWCLFAVSGVMSTYACWRFVQAIQEVPPNGESTPAGPRRGGRG